MSDRITELNDVETGDSIKVGSRFATVQQVVEGGDGLGDPNPHIVIQYDHGDEETRDIKEKNFGTINIQQA